MTFCSTEQDETTIISKVEKNENSFTINYLDNSSETLLMDKKEQDDLEQEIINQAIERDELMYDQLEEDMWKSLILLPISYFYQLLQKDKTNINFLTLFITLYSLNDFRKITKKLNELKKYRILIRYYKKIKENPNLLKLIHFDTIYYDNINIFTIDDYTLGDMKIIKKELIKKTNKEKLLR